jgi:single-stranded-DNA-specific exonuclease
MRITAALDIGTGHDIEDRDLVSRLLELRGVADIDRFLDPVRPDDVWLADFGYGSEIDTAMELLRFARDAGKAVIVYTDYDADGITGGSILWEALYLMGFKAMPYVPHRQTEGYGFSVKGIDAIKEQFDPGLIVSVDHGISAVDQIAYAKSIGIPVIVTDHHARQPKLPEAADAIFHIPQLSGSAVAYYFAKEVFRRFSKPGDRNHEKLAAAFGCDYLSLASIGTIADLVPLVGYSRSIAKYGLGSFSTMKRTGIAQIMKQAKLDANKTITPFDIGFVIAPRINAIGRLEHALDALRLLCTTNAERAEQLANRIGDMNDTRKELVKAAVSEAKERVNEMISIGGLPKVLILSSTEWHEGIIGLIASQMVEAYNRPAIIVTQGQGYLKGSCRSIGSFHITEFLGQLKHHLLNHGGHKMAGGFSIEPAHMEAFTAEAIALADGLITEAALEKVIEADIKLPVSRATMNLAHLLSRFEPYGQGNPRPAFWSECEVVDTRLMGKERNHLKITVRDRGTGGYGTIGGHVPLELVAFNKGDDYHKLERGQHIEVVYNVDVNEWNGKTSVQGKLIHWQ